MSALAPMAQPSPPTPPADSNAPLVITWAGPGQARPGEIIELQLMLAPSLAMRGLPFEIAYDAQRLQWLDAVEGEVFNRDGAPTLYQANADTTPGRLRVTLMRRGATALPGPGRLITLRFKALAAGNTAVRLENAQPIVLVGAAPPAPPVSWPLLIMASPK